MITRLTTPMIGPVANANIYRRYSIEEAAWIWHPEVARQDAAVLDFQHSFRLQEATTVVLHVSADQRYELSLDGTRISRGPDRGDLQHWSFASYEVTLAAGTHRLSARVWWIGDLAPCAQVSHRGGFILKSEGLATPLDTGTADWQVAQVQGISYGPSLAGNYHVIGPSFTVDGAAYHQPHAYVPAVVIDQWHSSNTGLVHPGWHLEPSPLPEQIDRAVSPGRIRVECDMPADAPVPAELAGDSGFQLLLTGGTPATLPANSRAVIIWDLEDYYCGYPRLTVSGGAGASVTWEWAESLFEITEHRTPKVKGNRDEVVGKRFYGFGDTFLPDGEANRDFYGLWWRSGRYVRLTLTTGAKPLTINGLAIEETGYPIANDGRFSAGPADLASIVPLAVRGIQMCAHETYMDCPYYEQLMYVGDTRLEVLTTYAMTADDRLPKRAIELFDWSRWKTGFVAERYPSHPYQLSLTFSMLWVSMLRDHAMWRDDLPWCRSHLMGARCLLEHFLMEAERGDGLLSGIPGWSFVDWVPEYPTGTPPGAIDGLSAPVNLLYIQALLHAAEVEDACGELEMAARWRRYAQRTTDALLRVFWDEERGMIADTADHSLYSEHSQCLALINGLLDGERERRCLDGLLTAPDLARATVYFSFYLLEVYQRYGLGDELLAKMAFWQALVDQGFKTPVESPEPSRSDCHAWGSHPLFHFHATMAGIRPASPGFRTVRIQPTLGPLESVTSHLPHPAGAIDVALRRDGDRLHATVALPPGITGTLHWRGSDYPLVAGEQTLEA